MSCFQAQLRQTGLLLLQPLSRFAGLLFCAALTFASCIDLLQHSGLGDFQPSARYIAFGLKSRIPTRYQGLELLSLLGLSSPDTFDLFSGFSLQSHESLL
ncbi:hypothetical protein RHOFW104R3_26815 [Rhodanobacter denitrificans]|nr:hypothetical protein RHOFW104R3_26815 [Rhodanobacter denitrificans]